MLPQSIMDGVDTTSVSRRHIAHCQFSNKFGLFVMYHAARTCAVSQALTPGESGWVLPAEDTEAWVDQMTWCIRHPEAVRGMSASARRNKESYLWKRYRKHVAAHLTALITDSPASS